VPEVTALSTDEELRAAGVRQSRLCRDNGSPTYAAIIDALVSRLGGNDPRSRCSAATRGRPSWLRWSAAVRGRRRQSRHVPLYRGWCAACMGWYAHLGVVSRLIGASRLVGCALAPL